MRMSSLLSSAFLTVALLGFDAPDANAQDRISWWIKVIGASEANHGWTLFPPGEAIALEFTILNDEESSGLVRLEPGFFRQLTLNLVDSRTRRMAMVSEWQTMGACAGVPNCLIDIAMTLAPESLHSSM